MTEYIINKMRDYLTAEQLELLKRTIVEYELASNIRSNSDYLSDFINSKRFNGCSEKTIKVYRRDAVLYCDWYADAVIHSTKKDIEAFLVEYKAKHGISNVSLNNMRRNLSSFFDYLCTEDIISCNPAKKIKPIKEPKKIKAPFTDKELNQLRSITDIRDKAIIETLLSTGMRVSELCSLNRADLIDKSAVVIGKGNKQRRVYFSNTAWESVQNYLSTRTDTQEALFVSKNGNIRLAKSGIEKLVKGIGKQYGVVAYPHKFRRTMATNALNKGMPIQEVQALLGHSSINTTLIYCEVNEKKLKRDHSKYVI